MYEVNKLRTIVSSSEKSCPTPSPSTARGYPPPPGWVAGQPMLAAIESPKLTELQSQMDREKLKNDLRQEMDMASRMAAMEAAQRAGSGVVVNTNTNINNSNAQGQSAEAETHNWVCGCGRSLLEPGGGGPLYLTYDSMHACIRAMPLTLI